MEKNNRVSAGTILAIVGLLLATSFLGEFLRALSKTTTYALYVPTILSALVFWALGKGGKLASEWLRFLVSAQIGWSFWLLISWFSEPNIFTILDGAFLVGSSSTLLFFHDPILALPYIAAFHIIGVLSNSILLFDLSDQTAKPILIVSIIFHVVPLVALIGRALESSFLSWRRRNLGGWQRLHVALCMAGVVGCVVWITVNADATAASASGCIPIADYQRYQITIPVDDSHTIDNASSGTIYEFPRGVTDLEMAGLIEKEYPALKGKALDYFSTKRVVSTFQDADPLNSRSCPRGTLRPKTDASSNYQFEIHSHEKEYFWKNARSLTPRAMAILFYSMVAFLLASWLFLWVLDGFREDGRSRQSGRQER